MPSPKNPTIQLSSTMMLHLCALLGVVVVAIACSGGDAETVSPYKDGVFLDSAVQGLIYSSGNVSGVTDSTGKFSYEEGTTIEFKLGNIVIGSAQPAAFLTPVSLVSGATSSSNTTVINIARFLQTLDDDSTPSNGITLVTTNVMTLPAASIDFSVPASQFETNVGGYLPAGKTLVSATDASTHLNSTLSGL